MLEQVAGVFYIAMVVTRLVSLRSARAAGRDEWLTAMSTLELSPEPQSVRRARAWVVDELTAIGRDDLADAAELGSPSWSPTRSCTPTRRSWCALGGTATHPRVEVHDTSTAPPRSRAT